MTGYIKEMEARRGDQYFNRRDHALVCRSPLALLFGDIRGIIPGAAPVRREVAAETVTPVVAITETVTVESEPVTVSVVETANTCTFTLET